VEIAVSLLIDDGNSAQQRPSVVETGQIDSLRAIIGTIYSV
jgi:hypothetical protein